MEVAGRPALWLRLIHYRVYRYPPLLIAPDVMFSMLYLRSPSILIGTFSFIVVLFLVLACCFSAPEMPCIISHFVPDSSAMGERAFINILPTCLFPETKGHRYIHMHALIANSGVPVTCQPLSWKFLCVTQHVVFTPSTSSREMFPLYANYVVYTLIECSAKKIL